MADSSVIPEVTALRPQSAFRRVGIVERKQIRSALGRGWMRRNRVGLLAVIAKWSRVNVCGCRASPQE